MCSSRFVKASLVAWVLSLHRLIVRRGAVVVADPLPSNPPPRCQRAVSSFRITDIRCDDVVENRYHVEFEVINWSNAQAGGVVLALAEASDPSVNLAGGSIDEDGRPLNWEDIDGDSQMEYDAGDLEDGNKDGMPSAGEDRNANERLDNDPIPGNLGRNNTWTVGVDRPDTVVWYSPPGQGLPFVNLLESQNCRECVSGLPQRDGPAFDSKPAEYMDNGDNVQDGFVVTIDGMEPGCVAHMNLFLLGSGTAQNGPPADSCFAGTVIDRDSHIVVSIDDDVVHNEYGFGLASLVRLDGAVGGADDLRGGTFVGQRGFRRSPKEFFGGVHNVPDSPAFGDCGRFAMEFTHGLSCAKIDENDVVRESSCPKGSALPPGFVGRIDGRSTDFPTIDGRIDDGEWDDAAVVPLFLNSDPREARLGTAYVIVNCVSNDWYVRTEVFAGGGATGMIMIVPPASNWRAHNWLAHHVKVSVDPLDPLNDRDGLQVDAEIPYITDHGLKFKYVRLPPDEDEAAVVGWEAYFVFNDRDAEAMPGYVKIQAQVRFDDSDDEGVPAGSVDLQEGEQYCVCDGLFRRIDDDGDGPRSNCALIRPQAGGDPHFSTWSGERFTFHGECDLVLIRNPTFADGRGMHVHGRTKIRGDEGWSDMESVAIRIGDDVFEARGAREYWINGVRNARLPALIGGYQVSLEQLNARRRRLAYVFRLGGEKEIRIKALNTMMWVQIKGQQAHDFSGSDGLFGHHGNGNMIGRDGTIVDDSDEYGQEWQVRANLDDPSLFHNVEGPQYPDKCKMPPAKSGNLLRSNDNNSNDNGMNDPMADENVRLAIAKKACAHSAVEEKDDCIFDVVATRSIEVAEAY